jgi:hypothetical protein
MVDANALVGAHYILQVYKIIAGLERKVDGLTSEVSRLKELVHGDKVSYSWNLYHNAPVSFALNVLSIMMADIDNN